MGSQPRTSVRRAGTGCCVADGQWPSRDTGLEKAPVLTPFAEIESMSMLVDSISVSGQFGGAILMPARFSKFSVVTKYGVDRGL